jgi:TolA-binding protein
MCAANKRFFSCLFLTLLFVSAAGALRSQELPQPGKTPLSSPASAQQSNSSSGQSEIWTRLSERFDETLNQHEQTLNDLSGKLRISEANGTKLNDLLTQLSRQNEDLKHYNERIAERMQERDEDLAQAYDRIGALEKSALKHWIAHILMGVLIAGAIAFTVCRFLKIILIYIEENSKNTPRIA